MYFSSAGAQTLPYTTRTLGYSGLGTSVQGDVRAIGMSGATLGLGDSLTAAIQNPAGLALTLQGGGLALYGNTIADQAIQPISSSVSNFNAALGGNLYPWGVAVGLNTGFHEGQIYNGAPIDLQTQEWRISLARVLFHDKIALGANVIFGDAAQTFSTTTRHLNTIGVTASLLAVLPHRWLVGLQYTTAMKYSAPPSNTTLAGIVQPFQDVLAPERFGVGVGWIPNRFFRAGASLMVLGTSANIALLKDQTSLVGANITVQPRVGLAYTLIDFRDLEVRGLGGAYWETSRIANEPSRLHFTAGLELRPWVVELGFAFDVSSGYQNALFMGGVDVIKLFQRLELVPSDPAFTRGGTFPRMTEASTEGLPRALNPYWKPTALEKTSILEIGKQIPSNLGKKIEKTGDQLQQGFDDAVKGFNERLKERRRLQKRQQERESRWRRDPKRE